MSTDRLAETKARAEQATPGPWRTGETPLMDALYTSHGECIGEMYSETHAVPDALFTAHAREDIPYLLARVAALEAERDARLTPAQVRERIEKARA